MDRDVQSDIQQRLLTLQQTSVRYRAGEITDDSPLTVVLGGSSVPYTDVRSVDPVEVGDQVATLVFGNDMIVLGRIRDGGPDPVSTISSFTSSWVAFDAARTVTYYRDRGRVYISGAIKSGVIGSPAFTLPAGYRPTTSGPLAFAVMSNGDFGEIDISAAGVVTPVVGNNAYVFLHGISFRHDD